MAMPQQTQLVISDRGKSRKVPLVASGVLIGRGGSCDVILDSRMVSRQHARLYQDPFGRWIIEDLGSRNGVLVGGQRLQAGPVAPGDRILIGPFALTLSQSTADKVLADVTIVANTSLVESSPGEDLVEVQPDVPETLSGRWLKELNFIGDRLFRVVKSGELYLEACRSLSSQPDMAALVIRLPRSPGPLIGLPEVLACNCREEAGEEIEKRCFDVRLSRRVLEVARSAGTAVMASNVRLGGKQLELTVIDSEYPRSVFCAPICVDDDTTDILYLDVPSEKAEAGTLDFTRAVARQIAFAKKAILTAEETTKRRLLDHHLAMAREIQTGLTPKSLAISPNVDLALYYEPSLWVGGDYCDVWQIQGQRIAFAIAARGRSHFFRGNHAA